MEALESHLQANKFLREILSSIRQVIILTDLEGKVLFANPVTQETFGHKSGEFEGKMLSLIFTPEDLPSLYPNLLFMAKRGEPFSGEVMLKRKDETRFFGFLAMQTCSSLAEGGAFIVVSVQDIDQLKRLEQDFWGPRYGDLVKAASEIAHQLRNPLVGIGGFVRRLYKSSPSTPKHDTYYQHIMDNLNRIEEVVTKVEFFARLPKPSFVKETINELIEIALQPHVQNIEEKHIQVAIDLEEAKLYVDSDQIINVFSIIIENALDALSVGGNIAIRGKYKGNQFKIIISDNGPGIAEKDIPYIYTPFFSTKPDRVGMNLAIAKRIMESHGGRIWVKTKIAEGTTFSLLFPLERRRSIRVARLEV